MIEHNKKAKSKLKNIFENYFYMKSHLASKAHFLDIQSVYQSELSTSIYLP